MIEKLREAGARRHTHVHIVLILDATVGERIRSSSCRRETLCNTALNLDLRFQSLLPATAFSHRHCPAPPLNCVTPLLPAIRDRAEGLHARKGTAAKAFNAVLLDQSTKIKAAASREKEEYTRALRSVLENLKAREEALDSAVMDTESAIAHELDAGERCHGCNSSVLQLPAIVPGTTPPLMPCTHLLLHCACSEKRIR